MILELSLFTFSASLLYVILFGLPISLFTYHPLLVLIALICITEGIASLQRKVITNKARNVHAYLQGIGFVAMVLSVSVIYYNKILNDKPHFTTLHGQLGILSFTFMLIQVLVGSLFGYAPELFGGIAKVKKLYKYHRISGYILLFIVWFTALSGVQTPFLVLHENLLYIYSISVPSILFSSIYFKKKKI